MGEWGASLCVEGLAEGILVWHDYRLAVAL